MIFFTLAGMCVVTEAAPYMSVAVPTCLLYPLPLCSPRCVLIDIAQLISEIRHVVTLNRKGLLQHKPGISVIMTPQDHDEARVYCKSSYLPGSLP